MNTSRYSPDTTLTLQSLCRPGPRYESSLFGSHLLHIRNFSNPVHTHYPSDWIVLSFLGCFIIAAWVQFFYFKRLRQICLAPLSQRFLNILIKDGNLFKERITLALALIYLFNFSLMLSLILKLFIPVPLMPFRDYEVFTLCAVTVVLFCVIKLSAIRLLGAVFQTRHTTMEYLQNILSATFITGLFLLPMLILTLFLHSEFLLYISLIIICLIYVFRVMRGYFIGTSLKKFSYLFLFVYLCALEILPLLVILKGLFLFSKGF